MSFTVELEKFDGPLDLMLHLIHEQKLDIFDLDIALLCDQFIAYIKQLEHLHLEVESEYLAELAKLIKMKSDKLLPKEQIEYDDEYEEDPKEKLVKRLLEYQQYKEISKSLNEFYLDRQENFSKPVTIDTKFTVADETVELDANPYDLVKAMNKVLRRFELSKPLETRITEKEISIEDRVLEIRARMLELPETFTFDNLLEDCESLHKCIVTFLAVLDLAKNHQIYFTVDDEDKIYFRRGAFDE